MSRNFVVLFVAVNVLILAVGGFLAYSDLYVRKDMSPYHENTTLIEVEYSPLAYRPTYEYWELDPQTVRKGMDPEPMYLVVTKGSLTLDFFQLSIIAVIISILWFLAMRQKSDSGINSTS
ncbi:MAG: hypothetical protein CW716_05200 [Candidatus Bathyarchaeum sp.]|nr:MAG: hypothetical protein CW716_05200 [Candidatus Bathyarchaeum sp.]